VAKGERNFASDLKKCRQDRKNTHITVESRDFIKKKCLRHGSGNTVLKIEF
jgi:hypothetical protein